jgi:hypothetical protein
LGIISRKVNMSKKSFFGCFYGLANIKILCYNVCYLVYTRHYFSPVEKYRPYLVNGNIK